MKRGRNITTKKIFILILIGKKSKVLWTFQKYSSPNICFTSGSSSSLWGFSTLLFNHQTQMNYTIFPALIDSHGSKMLFFGLICALYSSMKTRQLKIRFEVLEHHWDNFWSHQIFFYLHPTHTHQTKHHLLSQNPNDGELKVIQFILHRKNQSYRLFRWGDIGVSLIFDHVKKAILYKSRLKIELVDWNLTCTFSMSLKFAFRRFSHLNLIAAWHSPKKLVSWKVSLIFWVCHSRIFLPN